MSLRSGVNKIGNWDGTAGYMAAHGFFAVSFFLFMAIGLEVGGGLSLLLGFRARIGALALVVFLIPATLIFHAFWNVDAAEQQAQMINFLKNISIMGGLTLVIAHGAGPVSLDARTQQQR